MMNAGGRVRQEQTVEETFASGMCSYGAGSDEVGVSHTTGPCGLPDWFGRNLAAWNDTLGEGAVSAVLDAPLFLVIRVLGSCLFAPDNPEGAAFVEATARTAEGRIEVQVRP